MTNAWIISYTNHNQPWAQKGFQKVKVTYWVQISKQTSDSCHAHAPPLLPQAPSGMHPLASLSNNHYTALRLNHSLQEFHPTQQDNRELNHLQKIAFLFITLRYLLYAF